MTDSVPEQPEQPERPERPERPAQPDHQPADAIQGALDRLDGLGDRPVAEHAEAFEELHNALTEALSSIDGM